MTSPINIQKLFDLTGKVAIVTGSAEGIGNGIARNIAAAGAFVAIADINLPWAERAASEIIAAGGKAKAYYLDQSREQSIVEMVATVRQEQGAIDILVNNAGIVDEAVLAQSTSEQWDRLYQVNLRGAFLCLREAAEIMRRDGTRGRIVNISSMGSLSPVFDGLTAYNATKSGVNGLTRNAAYELAKDGITVNSVLPGAVVTEGQLRRQKAPVDPEMIKAMTPPLGSLCTPEDIGQAVLFFVSPASKLVTAQFLVVDGGHLNR